MSGSRIQRRLVVLPCALVVLLASWATVGRGQDAAPLPPLPPLDAWSPAAAEGASVPAISAREWQQAARTPAAPSRGSDDRPAMEGSWNHGMRLSSPDSAFVFYVGGRTQFDVSSYSATAGPDKPPGDGGLNPPLYPAANFRRARLMAYGTYEEIYDFNCEYDFVNQYNLNSEAYPTDFDTGPLPAPTDLWMQIREIPLLGTVRIGNQKDPFGFEHIGSSRWLNFMERSFAQDAFVGPFNNGFIPGIQVLNSTEDGRLAWQFGEFKNTSNPFAFASTGGGAMSSARLVWLPVYEDEGRRLVHLGVAGRFTGLAILPTEIDPATGQPIGPNVPAVRFRSRGSIRNGPPGPLNSIYADSGLLQGSWQNLIGLEFVVNRGPLSFQSEYFGSWLADGVTTGTNPINSGRQPPPGTRVGTVFYQAAYAEVLWFLTGESRTYSLAGTRFDRPIPTRSYRPGRLPGGGGIGAWQIGARYNYLCLSDGEVNGGVLNGVTLGLNWLMTPNARAYFNYDFTHRQYESFFGGDGTGGIHAFGTRLAFDF